LSITALKFPGIAITKIGVKTTITVIFEGGLDIDGIKARRNKRMPLSNPEQKFYILLNPEVNPCVATNLARENRQRLIWWKRS